MAAGRRASERETNVQPVARRSPSSGRIVVSATVPGTIALVVFAIFFASTTVDEPPRPPVVEDEAEDEVIYPAVLSEIELPASTSPEPTTTTTGP